VGGVFDFLGIEVIVIVWHGWIWFHAFASRARRGMAVPAFTRLRARPDTNLFDDETKCQTPLHWHLGVDLSAVARRHVLSAEMAAQTRARIRLAAGQFDRDQRFVLFAPAARELPRVVRCYA